MTRREHLTEMIEMWADEPESFENWDSLLKLNILIQTERDFKVKFNSLDIPKITGLETLLEHLERMKPEISGDS